MRWRVDGRGWMAIAVLVLVAAAVPRSSRAQDAPSAELTEGSARAGYPLKERPDGQGWDYEGPRFTAHIAPDGSVSFSDTPVDVRTGGLLWALPQGEFVAPAEDVTDTSRQAAPAYPVYGSPATTRFTDLPAMAPERMGFPDPPSMRRLPVQPSIIGGGVHFDVTDAFMRAHGDDPYLYQKLQFMEVTFNARLQIAQLHDQVLTRLALFDLRDYLEQIAQDPRLSPGERVQVLQALGDECDDTPEGRQARDIIERFLQKHLVQTAGVSPATTVAPPPRR